MFDAKSFWAFKDTDHDSVLILQKVADISTAN